MGIPEDLEYLLQAFPLFAVDVSLHTRLSSGDEYSVPESQASQSYCHWAGEHPEVKQTLMEKPLLGSELGGRSLVIALDGVVSFQEHVLGANAAVDTTHHHVEAKAKEVAVVEMTDTVI